MKPITILVVGCKGGGKTTFIERLVRQLVDRNLNILYVKHIHHGDFTVDVEGKDTHRVMESGAKAVYAESDKRIYVNISGDGNIKRFRHILDELVKGFDVVIYEGITREDISAYDIIVSIRKGGCRKELSNVRGYYVDVYSEYIDDALNHVLKRIEEILTFSRG